MRRFFSKKIGLIVLVVFSIAVLAGSGFFAGFRIGKAYPHTVVVKELTGTDSGAPAQVDFGTFWQAWQLIDESYLKNGDTAAAERVYGAIRGLIGALNDPYSDFFSPSENSKFQEDVRGDFGGIGAEIGMRKDQLVVVAPLKDTPASRIGLQPGDRILKINASSTEGMSVDQAVRFIRGPRGTEVMLIILRDQWEEPKEFKIVRDTIVIPTLDFEVKEGDIAYVHLYGFNANAHRLFYEAMVKALSQGNRGMVLDLRNNPGGYLEVAVQLAGWFLPRGTPVVSEAYRSGEKEDFRANGNGALVNFPVTVIINRGSASAAEILAGTLRDNRHIRLIGEQSFGKGTVQQLLPLRDGSSLKLTVAHWVLPSGKVLEEEGLKPDIEVKLTEEDVEKKRDPQLAKAIETLKEEMRQR